MVHVLAIWPHIACAAGRRSKNNPGTDVRPPKLDRSAPHHIRAISFIKLASALRNCSGL